MEEEKKKKEKEMSIVICGEQEKVRTDGKEKQGNW